MVLDILPPNIIYGPESTGRHPTWPTAAPSGMASKTYQHMARYTSVLYTHGQLRNDRQGRLVERLGAESRLFEDV